MGGDGGEGRGRNVVHVTVVEPCESICWRERGDEATKTMVGGEEALLRPPLSMLGLKLMSMIPSFILR